MRLSTITYKKKRKERENEKAVCFRRAAVCTVRPSDRLRRAVSGVRIPGDGEHGGAPAHGNAAADGHTLTGGYAGETNGGVTRSDRNRSSDNG